MRNERIKKTKEEEAKIEKEKRQIKRKKEEARKVKREVKKKIIRKHSYAKLKMIIEIDMSY